MCKQIAVLFVNNKNTRNTFTHSRTHTISSFALFLALFIMIEHFDSFVVFVIISISCRLFVYCLDRFKELAMRIYFDDTTIIFIYLLMKRK